MIGPKLLAWYVIGPKLAAWGVIRHSWVVCDLPYWQHVVHHFPFSVLDFRISFVNRTTDIKNYRYSWHHFLVLFIVPQPLISCQNCIMTRGRYFNHINRAGWQTHTHLIINSVQDREGKNHTPFSSTSLFCHIRECVPPPSPQDYDLYSQISEYQLIMVSKFQKTHFWAVKVIKLTVNVRSYPMDTENNLLVRADSFNGLRYLPHLLTISPFPRCS